MSNTTEKQSLRPPVKPSAIPVSQAERVEEAPQGAPAPPQSAAARLKPVCPDCSIEEMPNGEAVATIVIRPDILKRLKNRSQGLTVADYTWSYVIRPALESHVY